MRYARAMMVFTALVTVAGCPRDRAETAAEPTAAAQASEAAEIETAPVVEETEAPPAAEENARVVQGPNFEAAIFPASHPLVGRGGGRWTATDADVALAEELIADQLPTLWSDARDDPSADLTGYRGAAVWRAVGQRPSLREARRGHGAGGLAPRPPTSPYPPRSTAPHPPAAS